MNEDNEKLQKLFVKGGAEKMSDRRLRVIGFYIIQVIAAILAIIFGVVLYFGVYIGYGILALFHVSMGILLLIVPFWLLRYRSWAYWLTILLNIFVSIGAWVFFVVEMEGFEAFLVALVYSPLTVVPLIVVIYLIIIRDHFR